MVTSLTLTQSNVLTAMGNFLLGILPGFTASQIVVGQENLVAEPGQTDFVVMTPILRRRLATNLETYSDGYPSGPSTKTTAQSSEITIQLDVHGPGSFDNTTLITTLFRSGYAADVFKPPPCRFTGSLAAGVLTVTTQASGAIVAGQLLTDATGHLVAPTGVIAQLTGALPGGIGTYSVTGAQTVASEAMISSVPYTIAPLYADDGIETTFANAEGIQEQRWTISACLNIIPTIQMPQDFAAALALGIVDVDVRFPVTP